MTHTGGYPCALCARTVPRVTRHHLLPRSRARIRKRRGQIETDPLTRSHLVKGQHRPAPTHTIDLCPPCHATVHALLTEKQLERDYHSLASLLAHPEISRFVAWVARQPPDRRVDVRRPRDRR